jgi:hypothetical protein
MFMKVLCDLLFGLGVVLCVCAPAVVVVGICGVGTLVSHTIRVIRNLVFSIFVGEVSWCDWAVRMGDLCVWVAWCAHTQKDDVSENPHSLPSISDL